MVAALIAGLALAVQAPERSWEKIGEDPLAEAYVDSASISLEGRIASVVMRHVFRQAEPDGMQILVSLGTLDCATRTRTVTRLEGYRADGSQLNAFDLAPDSRIAVPLGTAPVDQALLRRACGSAG